MGGRPTRRRFSMVVVFGNLCKRCVMFSGNLFILNWGSVERFDFGRIDE